jgi:hypothetical protein
MSVGPEDKADYTIVRTRSLWLLDLNEIHQAHAP